MSPPNMLKSYLERMSLEMQSVKMKLYWSSYPLNQYNKSLHNKNIGGHRNKTNIMLDGCILKGESTSSERVGVMGNWKR